MIELYETFNCSSQVITVEIFRVHEKVPYKFIHQNIFKMQPVNTVLLYQTRHRTTSNQRFVCQRWNLQRWTTSNQRNLFQRWFKQRQTTSKQSCHFQSRFSQRWATPKRRYEYDHLKEKKPRSKHKIIFLSFKAKLFKLNRMDSKFSALYSLI